MIINEIIIINFITEICKRQEIVFKMYKVSVA